MRWGRSLAGGPAHTAEAFDCDISAEVNVSQFESALVWCGQFSMLFAVVPPGGVE
jgi:hypothetical protein